MEKLREKLITKEVSSVNDISTEYMIRVIKETLETINESNEIKLDEQDFKTLHELKKLNLRTNDQLIKVLSRTSIKVTQHGKRIKTGEIDLTQYSQNIYVYHLLKKFKLIDEKNGIIYHATLNGKGVYHPVHLCLQLFNYKQNDSKLILKVSKYKQSCVKHLETLKIIGNIINVNMKQLYNRNHTNMLLRKRFLGNNIESLQEYEKERKQIKKKWNHVIKNYETFNINVKTQIFILLDDIENVNDIKNIYKQLKLVLDYMKDSLNIPIVHVINFFYLISWSNIFGISNKFNERCQCCESINISLGCMLCGKCFCVLCSNVKHDLYYSLYICNACSEQRQFMQCHNRFVWYGSVVPNELKHEKLSKNFYLMYDNLEISLTLIKFDDEISDTTVYVGLSLHNINLCKIIKTPKDYDETNEWEYDDKQKVFEYCIYRNKNPVSDKWKNFCITLLYDDI